jgi:hypothetical protein
VIILLSFLTPRKLFFDLKFMKLICKINLSIYYKNCACILVGQKLIINSVNANKMRLNKNSYIKVVYLLNRK